MTDNTDIIKQLQGEKIDYLIDKGAKVVFIASSVTVSLPDRGTVTIDEFGIECWSKEDLK